MNLLFVNLLPRRFKNSLSRHTGPYLDKKVKVKWWLHTTVFYNSNIKEKILLSQERHLYLQNTLALKITYFLGNKGICIIPITFFGIWNLVDLCIWVGLEHTTSILNHNATTNPGFNGPNVIHGDPIALNCACTSTFVSQKQFIK